MYIDGGNRLVLYIWVDGGWVDFDLVSFVVWLSRGDAMVEFVPLAITPHYCSSGMCYLPTEVVVSPVVPWIGHIDVQELGVGLV